jgi:ribose/xylose/arabinose/galactoside ABC-type transport system permease subunit
VGLAAVIFVFTTDGFTNGTNLRGILTAASFAGVIAIGQVAIMISGNFFSLSMGTMVAGAAMLFFWALQFGLLPAILIAIVAAAVVSGLQGYVVGSWSANSIVVTIAASVLLQGVIIYITTGSTVLPPAGAPSTSFLADRVGGIAVSAIVFLVVAIIVQIFLSRTRQGAYIFLVGANKAAARAGGIPTTTPVVVAFAIAGACSGVAGILLAGFTQGAALTIEGTLVFDAIAAVLVGGAAVAGGRGSAIATVLSSIGIAAITAALVLRDYSTGVQILIKGLIVIGAVLYVHVWSKSRSAG